MYAPSAARNVAPIVAAMRGHVPNTGCALEIASGTGEHVVAYAAAFPGMVWQPTDIQVDRLISIDAWRAEAGVANMRMAQFLDASRANWDAGRFDLVTVVNLLHLISDADARHVIQGVARSLRPGGRWVLYGPFRTGGAFRSDGDVAFDNNLRRHDPAIGYKDLEWVEAEAQAVGLSRAALIEMPANNLMLVMQRTP